MLTAHRTASGVELCALDEHAGQPGCQSVFTIPADDFDALLAELHHALDAFDDPRQERLL